MDKFSIRNIAEIGRAVTGKTPSSRDPEDFGDETPFVTPSDSFDCNYIGKTERSLSAEGVRKLKGKLLPPDSVLVTCIGSAMGKAAMNRTPCITNQQINSIVVSDKNSPHYIYYALKNSYKQLRNASTGSTALPLLSKGDFNLLPIRIHSDKLIQQQIAAVLSALDAKIDLNNRINAELEALAKTIYDYWFVQFDFPDANGRPYKSSGGAMVWNDTLKREIPAEWEGHPISELVSVSTSSLDPAQDPEKTFRHLSIPGFDASGSFVAEPGSSIGSNKFTVERHDLLVSKLNPWFNRVVSDTDYEDMICSTEFVVWRCGNPSRQAYLNMIATHPRFVRHCTQSATGTSNSHKRVNPQVMMRYQVPYCPRIAEQFGNLAGPMLARSIGNTRENRELTQLRDWLLPLLMNGQVRVTDSAP